MALKETLNQKIPRDLQQTPEYNILLNLIKKEKITSVEGLRHYLAAEIKKYKQCLKECNAAGSTTNRKRGKEAHTIEFLELIKQKIVPHLI